MSRSFQGTSSPTSRASVRPLSLLAFCSFSSHFYSDADGKFGIRIESALLVRRITTKHEFNGAIWLGFERLTVVPIQTKMVRDAMLSKDELAWVKEHNRKCFEALEPLIQEDKRALKWLRREAERGVGTASPVPGGFHINWD